MQTSATKFSISLLTLDLGTIALGASSRVLEYYIDVLRDSEQFASVTYSTRI